MTTTAFPRGGDYQLAMQNLHTRLRDSHLQAATVLRDSNHIPVIWSGGFAITFQVTLTTGQRQAVRCYTQPVTDMGERYARIIPVLYQAPPGLFAECDFQREGVLVNGNWYPIQTMEWIEGQPLNNWIGAHLNVAFLRPLVAQFDYLVAALEGLGMAHGDLQHGNILVDTMGQLCLIDYDGMYVPHLAGYPSNNQGQRNYQHPARRHEFDASLDRFSTIVIGLALRALVADPTLWDDYGQSGECLLFTQADFLHPEVSPLLQRLAGLPACMSYIANFRAICRGRIEDVPRLTDFLHATAPLVVHPMTRPLYPWVTTYPVLDAGERNAALLPYEGRYVELVGKVERVEVGWTDDAHHERFLRLKFRRTAPYDVASPATCTVLLFKEGLEAFAAAKRDPETLVGQWIAVQHILEAFMHKRSTIGPRPQMRVVAPNAIVVLSAREAQQRLASGESAPVPPVTLPPTSHPSVTAIATAPSSLPAATGFFPTKHRQREEDERAQKNRLLWEKQAITPSSPSSGTSIPAPTPTTSGVIGTTMHILPSSSVPAALPPLPATATPKQAPPSTPIPTASLSIRHRWTAFWHEVRARLYAALQELRDV